MTGVQTCALPISAEILGRPGELIFTPEDRAAGAPEQEAEAARQTGRAAAERWHLRKDGSRFFASGVLTPLEDGGSNGYVKVLRDLTERKRQEDELEERVRTRTAEVAEALAALEKEMRRRRELARRLATVQEDERRRVSRDLHDTLGQLLTGLSLAFAEVEGTGELAPEAAARLAEARRLADQASQEAHALAVRLRPTALDDLGLEAALGQLVAEWSARSGVAADFLAVGVDGRRLPPEVETAIYRVVQEALTNVARHARATQASVVLRWADGRATAMVEDDGAGFDPDAATARLGLVGMRERVALAGGELEVESSLGKGTTVVVHIPVPEGGT